MLSHLLIYIKKQKQSMMKDLSKQLWVSDSDSSEPLV